MIRLENVWKTYLQDVLKTDWRRLEDVFARRLEDVLKTSSKRLEDVLARRLENVLKTSWRRIAKTNILVLTKTSWRRLEDVFWRHKAKVNIFVLIKTSWRRLEDVFRRRRRKTSSRLLHQDECLLGLWVSPLCFVPEESNLAFRPFESKYNIVYFYMIFFLILRKSSFHS